ncbi:MAG: hypothetical protein ABJA10_02755 [Aestuariivirga sp.]
MPVRAKINEDAADGRTVHAAINGIDEALLNECVASIEDEQSKIDEIMLKAREACQPHKDQIKAIKKDAAQNGITKEPFNAALSCRNDDRRKNKRRANLSEHGQAIFDEVMSKVTQIEFGDLPMFKSLDH